MFKKLYNEQVHKNPQIMYFVDSVAIYLVRTPKNFMTILKSILAHLKPSMSLRCLLLLRKYADFAQHYLRCVLDSTVLELNISIC